MRIAFVLVLLASSCVDPETAPPCSEERACPVPLQCSPLGVCVIGDPCAGLECGPGEECVGSDGCKPGGPCGESVRLLPPAVLFVVDRSCSMDNELGTSGVTKWEAAADAVTATVEALDGRLSFGLALFPDTEDDRCEQSEVAVGIGVDSTDDIGELLAAATDPNDALFPDGPCVTNIDTAVDQASTLLSGGEREAQVVLVSDGRQAQCNEATGEADATATIAAMFDRGIETVVVGFDRAVDADILDGFAQAGGRPNPELDVDFYPATDPAALEERLLDLADDALDCSIRIEGVPPDPAQLFVFLDDEPTAEFTYQELPRAVVLSGAACAAVESEDVARIDVVFGGCAP